jgi:hypothetical protein
MSLVSRMHKNLFYNPLFRSVQKHGIHAFTVRVLEFCDSPSLLQREQHYIDALRPQLNIRKIAVRSRG